MAESRYDAFKVRDGSNMIIPSRVTVYDGSSMIDYGTKNSYVTKMLGVYDGSSVNILTYSRVDVSIPNYIEVGTNKYIDLKKSTSNYVSPIDNYHLGWYLEMQTVISASSPLYTAHVKNNGDIYGACYINIKAEVSSDDVRIVIGSRWKGVTVDGKDVNVAYREYITDWCFNVGEKVTLKFERLTSDGGPIKLTVTREDTSVHTYEYSVAGTKSGSKLQMDSMWVANVNNHKLGSATIDDYGHQQTYGSAKIYYFKHKIDNSSTLFGFATSGLSNGVTTISNQYGSTTYTAGLINTSVYGESYTEYNRQNLLL